MGGYLWEGVVVKDQEQVGGAEREGNGIVRFGSARGAPSRRRQRRGDRGEVVVEWSWLEVSWRLVLLPQKVLSNDSRKKRTSRFWCHTCSLARVIRRCPVPEHDEMRVGHAHGRERKSGMGVTFLPSHCRKGVEWHVNRHEIVGLVGIAPPD